jgi:predicted transcriptional regulator
MQELTKAQEQILRILWEIEEGVVTDIIERLPEPKPAYNTVSTVVKVLEKKAYVDHKVYGKTHVYYPVVTKKKYTSHIMKDSLKSLFNGSVKQAVSFFVRQKDADLAELEELKLMIEQEIEIQKQKS